MRYRFARDTCVALILLAMGRTTFAQPQTVYEPSANDPRIKAVLDARERAAAAAGRADWNAVEASFAPDVVVPPIASLRLQTSWRGFAVGRSPLRRAR